MSVPAPGSPPPVVLPSEEDARVERLIAMAPGDAEAFCNVQVTDAVQRWRVQDALAWQRIRFRVRWHHALQRRVGGVT